MRFGTLAASILAGAAFAAAAAAQEKPVLTVYTYDSFASDWGPGPQVERDFEAVCGCDLRIVGTGDGAAMLGRIRLEGVRTRADVVLGLDTNLMTAAADSGLFALHGIDDVTFDLPLDWDDDMFVPFDWGYLAFVYDRERVGTPPRNFRELADSDLSIVIEDPRSSTPGLGLLLWVEAAYGDEAGAIWEGLADNIVTVTKGWSEAYGLFLEGEADMVLSYSTSPAYHMIAEDDASKAAALFDEGHYLQIEVAARVASSNQPELGDAFLRFLVGDIVQSVIPTTNWMYPAVIPEIGLPDEFGLLIAPEVALLYPANEAAEVRDAALEVWRTALSR